MKSHKWLIGGIAMAVLSAVVIWACRSEYGEGYSEDQRRNWNELIERAEDSGRVTFSYAIRKRQSLSDAPIWKLDFPTETVELPLEGVTLVALADLADKGNGDACLEFVFRYFEENSKVEEFGSLDVVFEGEKYLKKAVAAGRPGSDFLLRLFEQRKMLGDRTKSENVEGYRAFLSHLDAGDFLLGKIYFYLAPEGDFGLNRLAVGLEKKAAGGDVTAWRDRGYMEVLKLAQGIDDSWSSDFFEKSTSEAVSWWYNSASKVGNLLPDGIKPKEATIREIQDKGGEMILAWCKKKAKRRLKKPLGMIMKAAERGDIHAKFLWNQYSVWGAMKFSRKEWETHLRYADELIKAGGRYAGKDSLYFYSSNGFSLESSFYETQSWEDVSLLVENKKEKEWQALFPSSTESSDLSMEMNAKCNVRAFVDMYLFAILGAPVEKTKGTMRGLELMKEAAKEGNPFALYGLARMLNEGVIVEPDGRKAWELLQQYKKWREGICEKYLRGIVPEWVEKTESRSISTDRTSLDDAIDYQQLDVVSRHGDMPGMTVEQAFEQFSKMGGRGCSEWKNQVQEQFEKRGFKVPDEKK